MSIWTHVDGFVRSKTKISKTVLEEVFGKEMKLVYIDRRDFVSRNENGLVFDDEGYEKADEEAEKHNAAEWSAYAENKSAYMPCGSEGSLRYSPMKKVGDNYEIFEYGIHGALRDFSDEDSIIKWFRKAHYELGRKVAPDDPWAIHGRIEASSGCGVLSWETNNPEWFK